MVELLIEYGADVNVAGEGGDTPLHNASAGRCVSRLGSGISSMDLGESDRAIDLLLDAGADITAKTTMVILRGITTVQWSATTRARGASALKMR